MHHSNFLKGENMREKSEIVYLSFEEAQNLVDRIADRAENFNYSMSENEKEAMACLLSDVGVKVSDLIDVSFLADNYAINAEIVGPEDYDNYNLQEVRQDSLFSWRDEDGENVYCLSW
jgi:hypothetical protein